MPDPCPPGGREQWLLTRDKVRLRAISWPQDSGQDSKGSVLILHGRTEYIEKYFETIGELRARGFAVGTFDWRGQGLSDRALTDRHKGHVSDFSAYHHDLDAFLDQCAQPNLPLPYTLLAHSMGAHIAVRYLHERPQPFARAILCSPMAYINTTSVPHLIARAIAALGAKLGKMEAYVPLGGGYDPSHNPFEGNPLTHDAMRYAREAQRISRNPDLAIGSPTLGWLNAAYHSMAKTLKPEFAAAITRPVLMLYGSEELVSLPRYQALLASRLGNCQAQCIAGARHEILQETDQIRAQFWAAFDAFMK